MIVYKRIYCFHSFIASPGPFPKYPATLLPLGLCFSSPVSLSSSWVIKPHNSKHFIQNTLYRSAMPVSGSEDLVHSNNDNCNCTGHSSPLSYFYYNVKKYLLPKSLEIKKLTYFYFLKSYLTPSEDYSPDKPNVTD